MSWTRITLLVCGDESRRLCVRMSNKYASACDFFLLMIAPRSVEKSCKSISTLRFQPCHVLSSAWTQWIFQGQTSHSSLLSRDAAPSFEAHQILVGILRLLPEMPSLRLSKCLPECYFFISRSLNTCQGVPIAAIYECHSFVWGSHHICRCISIASLIAKPDLQAHWLLLRVCQK